MEDAKRVCFTSSDDESFSSLNVEVSNTSIREVSLAELDTSEKIDTADLECSSAEVATDETSSRSLENVSNVDGVLAERENVGKLSSDGEFCSEEKPAGNESSSSSPEVVSDEESFLEKNVKSTSVESTVSEASDVSTEIPSDVERPTSGSSSVESPDLIHKSRESFEHLDYEAEITEDLISSLLKRFKDNQYVASSQHAEDWDIVSNCIDLFRKSYFCRLVSNVGGTLCDNYPSVIIVPVKEKNANEEEYPVNHTSPASRFDDNEYFEWLGKCRYSRVRRRFPVPVILIDGKFFCRSATLSNQLSIVSENIKQQPDPKAEVIHEDNFSMAMDAIVSVGTQAAQVASNIAESTSTLLFSQSLEDMHYHDRELLHYLGIDFIFDLMVEMEKLCIIKVTSSEKVNRGFYQDFNITQIPYPGCEFFEEYHRNGRNPEGLRFDWEAPTVTVECKVPKNFIMYFPDTDYSQYKDWDLVKLTEEYLLIQLVVITSGNHSALVHCISGWDRTPMFASLLRLSLWADHWIHDELTPLQMAYLTLGYDWYLFGHNLPERLYKNEEVMHFCFKFLGYIASDNFSMTKHWSERPEDLKLNLKFPEFFAGDRRKRLEEVQDIVLRLYHDNIITTDVLSTDAPQAVTTDVLSTDAPQVVTTDVLSTDAPQI
ncbi:myotubularin-related protein 14-like isoform X2 [Stegodyphus dumicola]|uniref:myotubularin-related protein 14-like isoform X1 n=1 Tax=Stegodyphus dumicola TaxID=202533 RepID=UPI0015A8A346|nr:myotubularin-related protein 14-like isoform X1 [Stegodyphus dumicola]XP_035220512.1 myotubularin-related protein 14-like isoform X2 [Stegodyphus dumicola]